MTEGGRTELLVPGGRRRLVGRVRVPGDKSISHRVLLLGALADGDSTLRGVSCGLDVARTADAIVACGASVRGAAGDGQTMTVTGGRGRLHEPEAVIDVGNSGTAIRLLAGWCAAFPWLSVIQGDSSIAVRPMGRVVEPLRAMGARIDGRDGGRLPPLVVRGGNLKGIDYRLPVPSAQVKAALLLAALAAEGPTTIREDVPTRAHTEELLAECGAHVAVAPGSVTVGPGALQPLDVTIPGDPSQAAFWVVAACIVPGSDLVVEDVYIGPARGGFLDVLRRMNADVTVEQLDPARRTASIRARYGPLQATHVGGGEVASLIDEVPVLAIAAAQATGVTTFADAAELRVKESDRVESVLAALHAVGVEAEGQPDGLVVHGRAGAALLGGTVDARGDHRVAMAAAVAGLAAEGPTVVVGWEAVATSYPGFEEDLRRCVS